MGFRFNASFECRPDDIAIRLVTVDRMSVPSRRWCWYTRGTPREPDLGNLDRRSCVLRRLQLSVVALMKRRNRRRRASRSVLPAGDIKRRRRRARTRARENPRPGKLSSNELTNELSPGCAALCCAVLYSAVARSRRRRRDFRKDLCNDTTARWHEVDKPSIN